MTKYYDEDKEREGSGRSEREDVVHMLVGFRASDKVRPVPHCPEITLQ